MKLNTRDRGEYNGLSKSTVLRLIDGAQKAEAKNRHFSCSPSEKAALLAYYDERLANMGESTTRGTPDGLICDGGIAEKTTAVDPFIPCGSIECRQDIRERYGKES